MNVIKLIGLYGKAANMDLEETPRQKIGCYRCTIFNASCHRTCVDYENKVLPELITFNIISWWRTLEITMIEIWKNGKME